MRSPGRREVGSGERPRNGRPVRAGPVWFFDLDNTLHDATHAIFAAIDSRMTAFVEDRLQVGRGEADRLRRHYWLRYGATLLGLVRHHGVDPHDFLHAAHDFDLAGLLRSERGLALLFARLPGRKVLLTNAATRYARDVVRALSIHRHLGAVYAIETMRVHGSFRPKPSRPMLRHMLARERVAPGRAILVEDSLANLRAARAVGYRTVLVTGHSRRRVARNGYVGLRIRSVRELPRALARLRR